MNKNTKAISKIIIAIVIIAILVIAFIGSYFLFYNQPAQTKILKVGIPAPLTGPWSSDGQSYPKAAQLFFDSVDNTMTVGGQNYTIQLVTGDTEDLETGKVNSVFTKLLTQDKVNVLITAYCSQINAEINMVKDYGIPYLLSGSPSQTLSVIQAGGGTSVYWMIFSYHPILYPIPDSLPLWIKNAYDQGILKPRDGTKFKVAMGIYDQPYAQTWSDRMKNDFGNYSGLFEITTDEKWPSQSITDWSAFLSTVRANPPDFLVFGDSQSSNAITFVDQFMQNPIDGCYLWLVDTPSYADFRTALGSKGNGIMTGWLGGGFSDTWAPWTSYATAYKAKYGEEAPYQGSVVYYECKMWYQACLAAGNPLDYQAVCNQLLTTTWTNTAIGTVKFDPSTHIANGDPQYIPAVLQQLWINPTTNALKVYNIFPSSVAFASYKDPPWFSDHYKIASKFPS